MGLSLRRLTLAAYSINGFLASLPVQPPSGVLGRSLAGPSSERTVRHPFYMAERRVRLVAVSQDHVGRKILEADMEARL